MGGEQSEVMGIFRDEVSERLDIFVRTLLELERGEGSVEHIATLFREAHTIKGSAAMLGLGDVERLAHAAEDLLADVRKRGSFPPELARPLLATADALGLLVDGQPVDVEAAVRALTQFGLDGAETSTVTVQPTPSPPTTTLTAPSSTTPPAESDPGRAIRVPAAKIDRLLDVVGETILHRQRLESSLLDGSAERSGSIADELDLGGLLLDELRDTATSMRTLPLATIVGRLPRAVRDIAEEHGKHAELVVIGAETELDRVILESLAEPLVHLLRNAVAHGIEAPNDRARAGKSQRGRIELRAEQQGGAVEVSVSDDGRGVSAAVLAETSDSVSLTDVVTRPGFSTSSDVTNLAGRGVGLDAVRHHVEAHRGTMEVTSQPGAGTRITMRLPLALALIDVLVVERAGHVYCLPLASVDEVVQVATPHSLQGRRMIELHGSVVPLVDLAAVLGAATAPLGDSSSAVVISAGGQRQAIACDGLLGEQETLVKSLGLLDAVAHYLGAAILGDGRVALIVDPEHLVAAAPRAKHVPAAPAPVTSATATARPDSTVLVVEDSFTVRELQRSMLEATGYRVLTATDGNEALERLALDTDIALVMTDVDMPGMDGFELTERVRANPSTSSLPVVMVTSRMTDDDSRRGVEAGVDAYIVKQRFDQQTLLQTVDRLIRT